MGRKKKYHPFDWIPYLFKGEIPQHPEDEPAGEEDTSGKESGGKKKKRRKGIDDENPVSFRTVNGPLTWQQKFYFVVRDLSYACGPMFGYIITALVCIIVGYPLTGMLRMGFEDYLKTYSNSMIALGVLITLRRMFRKSKKNGSTFFQDASLYVKGASWKKILMGLVFGTGCALFLSAVLTLIPKVWIFATYNQNVSRIYQRYDILLTIIMSAVFTPLVEEIIFRGYMLNRLLRRWPDLPALIVTTVVFSFMHGSSVWIVYAFVMGWIIGVVSMKENNILYGIFIHMGFNAPSVIQWFYYFTHPEKMMEVNAVSVFQTVLSGAVGFAAAALVFVLYRRITEGEAYGKTAD